MTKKEEAIQYFKEGYNCSQSVFLAYAKDYGIENEVALRMSASFGGGMGRMREVCGAASGMFMVAGLISGSADPKDLEAKKKNYEMVQRMAELFREKNERHSIVCRELLGLDTPKPAVSAAAMGGAAPEARTKQYYKKRPCADLVGDACEVIEQIQKEMQ